MPKALIKETRRKFIKRSLILSTGLLLTDGFWAEKFFVKVNEYFAEKSASTSVGLTFIQISDLHLNGINYPHQYIVKKINDTNPDLVFITGDAVDKAENLSLLDEFLSKINFTIKKVAIPGNWEYWGGIDLHQLTSLYKKHNGDLLINESRQYIFSSKTIAVTGIDDYIGGHANYGMALKNYTKSNYHVVLNHCPQYRDEIRLLQQEEHIDLILSGHTHGGQINLFGFVPFMPQGSGKYISGWYKETPPYLYVSKGVGTSILPVRLGARAEIAIFHI